MSNSPANTATNDPIIEIERRVLEVAKQLALDPANNSDQPKLKQVVESEVASWQVENKLGSREIEIANPIALINRTWQNLVQYGPLTDLLNDPDVWEISINAPDAIFVRRHKGFSGYHHQVFNNEEHVLRTVTRLLDESGSSHRKLDPSAGLQDAQLNDGSRVHIVHSDIALGGHMLINIRRHTGVAFNSLRELVQQRTLSSSAAGFLAACMKTAASILFCGAPGSGKTTLLSCVAAEIDPSLRVVIAEEVFETQISGLANVAHMQTRGHNSDRETVDLRKLVRGFLRMAPDVAIVGEVRDREALPLLLTLSSGVRGMTTIHAGSAKQALTRLRFISQLGETASEIPMSALSSLVSEAIDVVVYCERTSAGPQVMEIISVEDLQTSDNSSVFSTTSLFTRTSATSDLLWTGNIPTRLTRTFDLSGQSLLSQLENFSRQQSGNLNSKYDFSLNSGIN